MTADRRPVPAPVVGVLVATTVVLAALAGPWHLAHRSLPDLAPPVDAPVPSPRPAPSSAPHRETMPISEERWLVLVLASLLGLLVVLALAFVIRKLAQRSLERRAAREVDQAEPDLVLEGDVTDLATTAMRRGARQAAQVLEQEVPPGDAVIAAWVALESSAEKTGIHRDRAQTATEFTMDVLGSTHADPDAARTLLDLYLAARYSEHRLTQTDVDTARESLATIAEGLRS